MKKLITFAFLALSAQGNVALGQWVQVTDPGGAGINCLTNFGGNLYAGTSGGVFYSTNDGISWSGLNTPSGFGSIAIMGNDIFVADSEVILSTNGGKVWKGVDSGLNLSSNAMVEVLAVSGGNLFAGLATCPACDPVFISSDSGANWKPADNGLPGGWLYAFTVNGGSIYASLIDGGVFRSMNNGASWNSVSNGLPSGSQASMNALAVNGNNIFAASSNIDQPDTTSTGVYRSADDGATWVVVNNGLTDTIVNELISYNGNLFASTTTGVFLSTNNGDSWQYLNGEGQPKFDAYALLVHDDYLFASDFFGEELWRLPLSGLNLSGIAVSVATSSANDFCIFPNPATDELQILGGQAGTIHLFDLMGRELLTATGDGVSTTLDVSSLGSGIYFLRVGNQSTKVEIAR